MLNELQGGIFHLTLAPQGLQAEGTLFFVSARAGT